MDGSYYLIGACAALAFVALTAQRPGWALAALFAAVPFQHDVSFGGPFRFSAAELILMLSLGSVLLANRQLRLGPVLPAVLLYFVACLISCAYHWRETATGTLLQMFIYLILAVAVGASLPGRLIDFRLAFDALIVVGLLLGVMAVATRSMYFLGLHKNGIGSSLSAVFLISFAHWDIYRGGPRRWFYLAGMVLSIAGMLIVASRGSWLGSICGLTAIVILQRRFSLLPRIAGLGVVLIPLLWLLVPDSTQSFAVNLRADNHNVAARIESAEYAWSLVRDDLWVGMGVGLRKEYDATNLVISTLVETGCIGLGAFLLLCTVTWLCFQREARRAATEPGVVALIAIFGGLFVSRLAHGMVDHYWGRGTLTLAWLGVGAVFWLGQYAAARRKSARGVVAVSLGRRRTTPLSSRENTSALL